MTRLPDPIILKDALVRLEPLSQAHFEPLVQCAKDERIWQHMSIAGYLRSELLTDLRSALLMRAGGAQYPFTIIDQQTDLPIGSTRFFDIHLHHKKLEIGYTWYHPDYWRRGYNRACKTLLLQYCFEVLGLQRVQFKTRDTNLRSQAALKGIGAKYEGTLRKDRLMPGGEVRDSLVYSIVDDEWAAAKGIMHSS